MDADVVYQIAKVLDSREQYRLLTMLQQNLRKWYDKALKSPKPPVITDQEAILYLIKNVFSKVKNS
ncbi:MAG: hypothetical protein AAF934_12010 [Bacteroidota bacterium]